MRVIWVETVAAATIPNDAARAVLWLASALVVVLLVVGGLMAADRVLKLRRGRDEGSGRPSTDLPDAWSESARRMRGDGEER